jgi:hypothetical protein
MKTMKTYYDFIMVTLSPVLNYANVNFSKFGQAENGQWYSWSINREMDFNNGIKYLLKHNMKMEKDKKLFVATKTRKH